MTYMGYLACTKPRKRATKEACKENFCARVRKISSPLDAFRESLPNEQYQNWRYCFPFGFPVKVIFQRGKKSAYNY